MPQKKPIILILAITFSIGILIHDIFFLPEGLFGETAPIFNAFNLARSFFIAMTSYFWVRLIFCWRSEESHLRSSDVFSLRTQKQILVGIVLLGVFFPCLFLRSPPLFNSLVLEDNFVESCSALFYFLSAAVLIFGYRQLKPKFSFRAGTLVLLFAALVIGLEEVSWFQRVLDIDTPQSFEMNAQNELNFHNFFTNVSELIYYFGAFLFFILLPFCFDQNSSYRNNEVISFFVPSRFLMFVSAIAVAYNYGMWSVLFMQMAFFITLFILLGYYFADEAVNFKAILRPLFFLCLLTQICFLLQGDHLVRTWDVTEVKEFFIPLSFFIYVLELRLKIKKSV